MFTGFNSSNVIQEGHQVTSFEAQDKLRLCDEETNLLLTRIIAEKTTAHDQTRQAIEKILIGYLAEKGVVDLNQASIDVRARLLSEFFEANPAFNRLAGNEDNIKILDEIMIYEKEADSIGNLTIKDLSSTQQPFLDEERPRFFAQSSLTPFVDKIDKKREAPNVQGQASWEQGGRAPNTSIKIIEPSRFAQTRDNFSQKSETEKGLKLKVRQTSYSGI